MKGVLGRGNTWVICVLSDASLVCHGSAHVVELKCRQVSLKAGAVICSISCPKLALLAVGGREGGSVYVNLGVLFSLLLFPMQYSMPTLPPGGFLTGNTPDSPNAYVCTVQNQGHNFFSYVDCTLRKDIHFFIEVAVSHCIIHVRLSTLSAVLSVMVNLLCRRYKQESKRGRPISTLATRYYVGVHYGTSVPLHGAVRSAIFMV